MTVKNLSNSMARSQVTIEVALLGEFAIANGTNEFRLDAALVVLMSPQRREEAVAAVALVAHVSLPWAPLGLHDATGGSFGLCRSLWLTLVDALGEFVAIQRGQQGKGTSAVGAHVLPRVPTVASPWIQYRVVLGQSAKSPLRDTLPSL